MLPGWMTDELLTLLGGLSPRQRNAIVRIVDAEVAGEPMSALFHGERPICNESTYYRRKPVGWHWQERFQAALTAARTAAWAFGMEHAVQEAVQIMTITAPAAARELQRQVRDGEKDSDRRDAAKVVWESVRKAPQASAQVNVVQTVQFDVSELPAEVLQALLDEGEPAEAEGVGAGGAEAPGVGGAGEVVAAQ